MHALYTEKKKKNEWRSKLIEVLINSNTLDRALLQVKFHLLTAEDNGGAKGGQEGANYPPGPPLKI